jgi:predicted Zn-dependent protease
MSTARFFLIFWLVCSAILFPASTKAGLIRDAEIEEYLGNLVTPIARAAGVNPSHLRIFIVGDPRINAFVAGGSNIFINTGLLTEARSPEMVMGVLAHEMGHITGGHIIDISENAEQAQAGMILSYLLGAAAAAAGSPDVGMAIMSGGNHLAARNFLSHTRANEQAADQAALTFLDSLQLSSQGMLDMFERLRQEEKRVLSPNADAYSRTHPLSKERITHIRAHLESSPYRTNSLDKGTQQQHRRVRGKLIGYLEEPTTVMRIFPPEDTSDVAHIARALANMRRSLFNNALDELAPLLETEPNNAYFHEMQGHILFDARRYSESAEAYARAVELKPTAALLRSDYAKVLLAENNPETLPLAKQSLLYASTQDPTYAPTWRNLATIYGKEGNAGRAELCLAEIAALTQEKEELLYHLRRAEDQISEDDTEGTLRIEDLRLYAKTLKEKENHLHKRPLALPIHHAPAA